MRTLRRQAFSSNTDLMEPGSKNSVGDILAPVGQAVFARAEIGRR